MTLQYKLTVKRVFLTNFNSTSTNRFNVPNYLSRAKCLLSKQCQWGLFNWNIGTESNLSVVLFTRSLIQFCWLPTDIHVCTSSMHVDIKGSHNTMQQHSGQWMVWQHCIRGSARNNGTRLCQSNSICDALRGRRGNPLSTTKSF